MEDEDERMSEGHSGEEAGEPAEEAEAAAAPRGGRTKQLGSGTVHAVYRQQPGTTNLNRVRSRPWALWPGVGPHVPPPTVRE